MKLRALHHAVLPSRHNSYRPYLLSKPVLAFFLATIIMLETFFVASLFNIHYFELFFGVDDAKVINTALVVIIAVLGSLVVITFLKRMQIQPLDIVLPGAAMVGIAAFLLMFNTTYPFERGVVQTAAVIQSQVIALTNAERVQNNVQTLGESTQLDAAAHAKALDMATKGYFAHVGPTGKQPWAWIIEAGYKYKYAGENLAVRFNDSNEVVNAWMNSPSHRANIVKSAYQEIGVGTAEGLYEGQPATYIVQYFAAR